MGICPEEFNLENYQAERGLCIERGWEGRSEGGEGEEGRKEERCLLSPVNI